VPDCSPLAMINGTLTVIPSTDTLVIRNAIMAYFGDGSDGDVTVIVTVVLARDMYYNNLTVTSTGRLSVAGYRVFVKNTLTVASGGTVDARGGTTDGAIATPAGKGDSTQASTASNIPQGGATTNSGTVMGVTAAGGVGGSHSGANGGSGASSVNSVGGKGGAGGTGVGSGSGVGGSAGNVTAPTHQPGYSLTELVHATFQSLASGPPGTPTALCGGSGGGGGGYGGSFTAEQNATFGGGGGACGGVLVLVAYNVVNSGTINADGSAGGNGGGNAVDNKYGAGGGGGGGGYCIVLYRFFSGTAPTANGGAGGAPGGGSATAGSAGSAGKLVFLGILLLILTNLRETKEQPCLTSPHSYLTLVYTSRLPLRTPWKQGSDLTVAQVVPLR